MHKTRQIQDYVHFNNNRCSACAQCVRACPTKTIRVRDSRHIRFVDQCIGCGECIRVCPTGAATSKTVEKQTFAREKLSVAVVSPLLYTQFPGVRPGRVRQALKQIGFQKVIDLSPYVEMTQIATETYIHRSRSRKDAKWPLISPFCPVVLRLIGLRFPGLLPHVLPIKRLESLMASVVPETILRLSQNARKPAVIFHITPCPVIAETVDSAAASDLPWIERSLGINTIYPLILHQLDSPANRDADPADARPDDKFYRGKALLWGVSGGEISGISVDRAVAVSGLKETIAYLEKIDIGLLRDTAYFEFRTCPEGCIGGPFTALDKYMAKAGVQKTVRKCGFGRPLSRDTILKRYEQGWFFSTRPPGERAELKKSNKAALTLPEMQQIETLLMQIQGKNCSACGAPDCRTFAEDVVRGQTSLEDCLMLNARKALNQQKRKGES